MPEIEETDEERLTKIVKAHRTSLVTYACTLVNGDLACAEDVVQETFVRAWLKIDRMTAKSGSVSAWLHRVTHNIAVDGHRMRAVRPAEVELDNLDLMVREGHDDEIVRSTLVAQMLNSLWLEHRAVLVEFYLYESTIAEIANKFEIPIGTVKSRLFYAIRTLRGFDTQQQNDR
jgi:RNA polymerase sigma-70 factor (ECF subfamily)